MLFFHVRQVAFKYNYSQALASSDQFIFYGTSLKIVHLLNQGAFSGSVSLVHLVLCTRNRSEPG